jgi:hypothetical protein
MGGHEEPREYLMLLHRMVPAMLGAVARDYANVLGFPILLHWPRLGYGRRRPGRQLHVHLHALPVPPLWIAMWSDGSVARLPVVLGHRLADASGRPYAPPGRFARGLTLTDEDGHGVLHLSLNNVYVLFDLVAQPEQLAGLLLRKSLDLALPHLEAWISELAVLPAARLPVLLNRLRRDTVREEVAFRESARTRARGAYVGQLRRSLAEEATFLEEEVRATVCTVEELACQLTRETRHLGVCRQRLRVLQGEAVELVRATDDLVRLETLEGVREVEVYAGGIRVVTTPIEVAHAGARYRLGCFQLDLAESGAITVRNLTDPYGLYDHPHVWNGRPCLGNVREGLAKLVAEYQWVAVAEVLLDFLRTVTPRDWYIPITRWKAVPA